MCSLLSSILINNIKNIIENYYIVKTVLIIDILGQTDKNILY